MLKQQLQILTRERTPEEEDEKSNITSATPGTQIEKPKKKEYTYGPETELKNPTFLYLSKDIMDYAGIGRFELPFNQDVAKSLSVNKSEIIINGGLSNGRLFYGLISHLDRKGDTLSVSLVDHGVTFNQPNSNPVSGGTVGESLTQLIEAAEFTPKLDTIPKEILDKTATVTSTQEMPLVGTATTGNAAPSSTNSTNPLPSFVQSGASLLNSGASVLRSITPTTTQNSTNTSQVPNQATTGLGSSTTGCIGGAGKCSCSKGGTPGNYFWANKCPHCGGTLAYMPPNNPNYVNPCPKSSSFSGTIETGGAIEGHIFCCGCDADYCITCGKEHIDPTTYFLTPCSGGAASNGTPTTIGDMIDQICIDNGLYCYLDNDKNCIVKEFKGPEKAEFRIGRNEIPRDLYKILVGEEKEKGTRIKIVYKSGEIIKENGDVSKLKESDTQVYQKPELDQKDAEEFANKTLAQTLREKNIEFGMRALARPEAYPGKWVEVPMISDVNKFETFYLCGRTLLVTPEENILNFDLLFKLAPPLPPIETSNSVGTGTVNLGSLEAIGRLEATFEDIQHPHILQSQANSNDLRGSSDCFGDSLWLYNKLSAAGIQCQIVGDSGRLHRWVEINTGAGFVEYPYIQFNSQHHGSSGYNRNKVFVPYGTPNPGPNNLF